MKKLIILLAGIVLAFNSCTLEKGGATWWVKEVPNDTTKVLSVFVKDFSGTKNIASLKTPVTEKDLSHLGIPTSCTKEIKSFSCKVTISKDTRTWVFILTYLLLTSVLLIFLTCSNLNFFRKK